jgi:anti-sigma B factor antagonist
MNLSIEQKNDSTLITINKERLDVSNMQSFKDELTRIIDEGHHQLIIKLSAVTFIDSSGLSVLIGLFKRINTIKGGKLQLCGLGTQPTELLQITQLDKIFTIVNCD